MNRDRAKVRTCSKCNYCLQGHSQCEPILCPECGTLNSIRGYRIKYRKTFVYLLLFISVGYVIAVRKRVDFEGLWGLVPTPVMIILAAKYDAAQFTSNVYYYELVEPEYFGSSLGTNRDSFRSGLGNLRHRPLNTVGAKLILAYIASSTSATAITNMESSPLQFLLLTSIRDGAYSPELLASLAEQELNSPDSTGLRRPQISCKKCHAVCDRSVEYILEPLGICATISSTEFNKLIFSNDCEPAVYYALRPNRASRLRSEIIYGTVPSLIYVTVTHDCGNSYWNVQLYLP